MREAYKRGWITTRDGNCSVRMKNRPYLYITPSGVRKTIIHPESIVKIKIENEELQLENHMNPSGELWMHWFLLRDKKETLSVLHLHPTHCVAAMYAGYNLCDIITPFPEVYRYTKVGPNVPAVQATSMDLAEQTYEKMCVDLTCNKRYDIIGQEGHGVCAIAKNPWDAFEHIERLEHICQIVLLSGNRSKLLS
jgi:L-fuculose-phosphate aldolase